MSRPAPRETLSTPSSGAGTPGARQRGRPRLPPPAAPPLRAILIPALAATVAAAVLPGAGGAQDHVVEGLELWGGAGAWASGPGSDLPAGPRFGLAAFGASTPRRHFALEVVYGRFTPDGTRRVVSEFGVALAARWALGNPDRPHPFLQIRAGLHRLDGSATGPDPTQDALALGPELGVVVPMSERLGLLAGLDAAWQWSRDRRGDSGVIPGTGGHALRWGLRLGLTLRTAVDAGGEARGGPGGTP